jgi:hypothetical protein
MFIKSETHVLKHIIIYAMSKEYFNSFIQSSVLKAR